MPALKLTAFIGEQPRILPRLLPETAAQRAIDVRLEDGGLTPVRRSIKVTQLDTTGNRTIFRHGNNWLAWPVAVDAAQGPVADDRLYYTGDGPPKMRIGARVFPLAVPRPAQALEVDITGTGTGDVQTRLYAYTWVTEFGEESEPSPPTAGNEWKPGQTVTLSGFEDVPEGRAITRQRFYRTQTGRSGTYLYFIAERAASNAAFVDNIAVDAFNEPLPSVNWNAPPDGLEGLVALPNGMMAAFAGRDIWFCEPYHPHAWPEQYVLTTDVDIVGLAAIGTSMLVMTRGNPYLVSGSHPQTMQMVKIESNLPCVNRRGIVDLGYTIAYPSRYGLVAAKADGSIGLISENLFSRDDWLTLSPETFVCSQIGGKYAAFYDTHDEDGNVVAGCIFIDLRGTPFITRSAERCTAAFYDKETAALYYVPPDSTSIMEFDSPLGARRRFYWRSKPFVLAAPHNFGAIRVDSDAQLSPTDIKNHEAEVNETVAENAALLAAGPVRGALGSAAFNVYPLNGDKLLPIPPALIGEFRVGVYADDVLVAAIDRSGEALRLPSGFLARTWEIDVAGDAQIEQIAIGSTMDDLKAMSP